LKFTQQSHPQRTRVLAVAVLGTIVNLTCFLGLTPLYPQVAQDLGLDAAGLGILIGMPVVVSAAFQLPTGVAVDALGARAFMLGGLLLVSASQLLRWLSTDVDVFAAGQVALGLSLPLFSSAALTAVANVYVGSRRGQALGFVFSAVNLGQITGYLLVGFLAQFMTWRSISLALASLPLFLIPMTIWMPDSVRLQTPRSRLQRVTDAIVFLSGGNVAGLALIQLLAIGSASAATYLLPFALHRKGVATGLIGLLLLPYLVGALVAAPLAGRIAARVGNLWPLSLGLVLGLGGAAGLAAFGAASLAVAPCFFVMGICSGIVMAVIPNEVVSIAERSGKTGLGSALGGLRLAYGIGPAIGPPLAGAVFINRSLEDAYLTIAVVLSVAFVLCVRTLKKRAMAAE
jgi:predicted MFS family arabinose efflux permease